MNVTLAEMCWAFLYVIAPGLLVIRYFWPPLLPRWGVLLAAAGLGGTAFYLQELLYRADMTEVAQRLGVFDHTVPILVDGMVNLQGPRPVDFVLGGILELINLLLWLVPYGIIQILRNRRRQLMRAAA
jgi:hypothetical protein